MAGDEHIEITVVITNESSVRSFSDACETVCEMCEREPWNTEFAELRRLLGNAAEGLDVIEE